MKRTVIVLALMLILGFRINTQAEEMPNQTAPWVEPRVINQTAADNSVKEVYLAVIEKRIQDCQFLTPEGGSTYYNSDTIIIINSKKELQEFLDQSTTGDPLFSSWETIKPLLPKAVYKATKMDIEVEWEEGERNKPIEKIKDKKIRKVIIHDPTK